MSEWTQRIGVNERTAAGGEKPTNHTQTNFSLALAGEEKFGFVLLDLPRREAAWWAVPFFPLHWRQSSIQLNLFNLISFLSCLHSLQSFHYLSSISLIWIWFLFVLSLLRSIGAASAHNPQQIKKRNQIHQTKPSAASHNQLNFMN